MPEHTNPPENTQPTAPKPTRNQCRHVHLAGHRCGSPCLRGENFCYFHHTARRRPKHLDQAPLDAVFTLPPIDDTPSIQLALADILARICTHSIDNKRASLILYGLSIASLNLKRGHHPAAHSGPNPHPAEVDAVIEDLELDPDLGPVAPVARMDAADDAHKGLIQRFMDYVAQPPEPCKMCAYYEELERNRAEGRRLQAEVNRRRAAGLPEYPIEPLQPYPSDAAWAAEEARQALTAPTKPTTQPTPNNQQPATQPAPPSHKNCHPDPEQREGEGPASVSPAPPHAEDPNTPGLPDPSPETWAKFAAHLPNLKASAEEAESRPQSPGAPSFAASCEGWDVRRPSAQPATNNQQPATTHILPTLHAVAEEPTRKLCRTPTRTRRPKTPAPPPEPTSTPEPNTAADLARRTTRLTRAFRHRYGQPVTNNRQPATSP